MNLFTYVNHVRGYHFWWTFFSSLILLFLKILPWNWEGDKWGIICTLKYTSTAADRCQLTDHWHLDHSESWAHAQCISLESSWGRLCIEEPQSHFKDIELFGQVEFVQVKKSPAKLFLIQLQAFNISIRPKTMYNKRSHQLIQLLPSSQQWWLNKLPISNRQTLLNFVLTTINASPFIICKLPGAMVVMSHCVYANITMFLYIGDAAKYSISIIKSLKPACLSWLHDSIALELKMNRLIFVGIIVAAAFSLNTEVIFFINLFTLSLHPQSIKFLSGDTTWSNFSPLCCLNLGC